MEKGMREPSKRSDSSSPQTPRGAKTGMGEDAASVTKWKLIFIVAITQIVF